MFVAVRARRTIFQLTICPCLVLKPERLTVAASLHLHDSLQHLVQGSCITKLSNSLTQPFCPVSIIAYRGQIRGNGEFCVQIRPCCDGQGGGDRQRRG